MAQQVSVELVDDLDGSEAAETVHFGLDGVEYEIDLSVENAAELRDSLAQPIDYARRVGGRKRRAVRPAATTTPVGTPNGASNNREENTAIRAWARKNKYQVADRGRIPADIVAAYHSR